MATKLGDLLDEIVVVGGLVPYLLVAQESLPSGLEPHAGTMDLDMGLALAILNRERYRELGIRLKDAGFQPDVNDQGNKRLQSWTTGGVHPVKVDFLIPPIDETGEGGTLFHIESDLAAIVTPGLELAFKDRSWKELSGTTPSGARATRNIPVCSPGAFTVLKALAFHNRTENKDAYDLFYVWSGVGIPKVAECLAVLLPNPYIDEALSVIETDFCNHDGPGPIGTAQFITRGRDDDVQADVVGLARELLHVMERL
ncbi:MAG: nucleotidyl transferase AbiEii/AbiGii toxin family protein [Caldilineaceae bacterium]|nr:nucleotidyl transferase AbiEii/AbiGii toxin family protein [Caldilineaceae bacterium]